MTAPKKTCTAPGCTTTTVGYSQYCANHRATMNRHGHSEQTAVKRKELATFEGIVRKYLTFNPDAGAWDVLDQMWLEATREARKLVDAFSRGTPMSKHRLAAAREILKTDRDCDWKEVMAVVAAAWMLQETQPSRFKSDNAFRVQVARLVRQIVPRGGNRYLDQKGIESKKAPYIAAKQSIAFGQILIEIFAPLGIRLLELEKAEDKRKQKMQRELATGFASIR